MNEIKERKVLGRGFGALLPNAAATPAAAKAADAGPEIKLVALEKVHANRQQPRKRFAAEAIQELSNSIREKGILQPLMVQARGDGDYELIAGERRLRAASLAGLRQVPVIVRQTTPEDSLELAMIENIQRQDLNAVEEALGYQNLMQRFQLSQDDVAKKVGKSRSAVANALRLLKLPSSVQTYLAEGKLTAGQVRPLIGMQDNVQIEAMAEQILNQGLSARSVEAQSAAHKPAAKKPSKRLLMVQGQQTTAFNYTALQDQLRRHFGTKIEINEKSGRGSVQIHFYSMDELKRVLSLLGC